MHRERRDLDGAVVHTERGLEVYRRLPGALRWEMGAALGNLAGTLMLKGEYDRAEPLARESLDVYRSTVGEAHAYPPRSLATLANPGRSHAARAARRPPTVATLFVAGHQTPLTRRAPV